MKTMVEMAKELISLLIMIEVGVFLVRMIFRNTFIGRILLMGRMNSKGHFSYRKNVWKRRVKRTKTVIRFMKMVGKKIYVVCKKKEVEKPKTKSSKKVVNGGKVIDFQTAKELRLKWDK